MKKLMFFICLLLLLGAYSSCNNGGVDIPKDVKLNVTVSTDMVKVGETVIITCLTENAERTSSNIGAPTGVSWTYPLVVTGKITITVFAYGAGKSISLDKVVDVLPVIVPTKNDSLRAHGWKLKSKEFWRISTNTPVSYFELSAIDLSDVTLFTSDNYWKQFHSGQTIAYASFWYTLTDKIITSGDLTYTITILTGSKLQLEQVYRYAEDQKIVWLYEAAP